MRFHSTSLSALNGEITKLAITECVVSVAVYVAIGVYLHTFSHFAIAVAVAPLMLFRTESSVHWGLKTYNRYCIVWGRLHDHVGHISKIPPQLLARFLRYCNGKLTAFSRMLDERLPPKRVTIKVVFTLILLIISLVFIGVLIIGTIILLPVILIFFFSAYIIQAVSFISYICGGHLIRTISTLYWLLRTPLHTLSEMPGNWIRQSFCTDVFYPPEILPLESSYGGPYALFRTKMDDKYLHISTFTGTLLSLLLEIDLNAVFKSPIAVLLLCFALGLMFIFGWIPSLLYRISFKATSLVYSPFVWMAHSTLRSPLSIKLRLERITKGELEKTGRYVSAFALTVLAAKIGLALGEADVNDIVAEYHSLKFVKGIVAPNIWPWWLVTLWAAALLNYGIFYYADAAMARLDSKDWAEQKVTPIVSAASFLRALLAGVTMVYCFQYALIIVAGSLFQYTI